MILRKGQTVIVFDDRRGIVQKDTKPGDTYVIVLAPSIGGLMLLKKVELKDVKPTNQEKEPK